jgi:hypothetical protein
MLVSYILFCLINSIYCLNCTVSKKQSFVLNTFNNLEFEKTINNLNDQPAKKKKCYVKLIIAYTNNRFDLEFPEKSPNDDNTIQIEMTFLPIHRPLINQSATLNIIYSCSSRNDCNRYYVFGHISSMIAMNYSEIQGKLFQLFSVKQKGEFSCYLTTRRNYTCQKTLCVAIEKDDEQLDARCPSQIIKTTAVNIIVLVKNNIKQEMIKYVCNFDGCNNESTFKNVKNTVESYQNLLSKYATITMTDNAIIQIYISKILIIFTFFISIFQICI